MSDTHMDGDYEEDYSSRPSRPTLAQVRALVGFLQKHPDLAHRKLRGGMTQQKVKKLWVEASDLCNSIDGTLKSSKGWVKFWSDKRRSVMLKKKQIDEGSISETISLTPIEQKIYDLCQNVPGPTTRKKKAVKIEPYNGHNEGGMEESLFTETQEFEMTRLSTEADDRQLGIMEKLVDVMDQQAQAMSQMAQAAEQNSKAIEQLAEAAHMQALAVDRLANTFESISASVTDVRNCIVSIDYCMKRYVPSTASAQRHDTNLFS